MNEHDEVVAYQFTRSKSHEEMEILLTSLNQRFGDNVQYADGRAGAGDGDGDGDGDDDDADDGGLIDAQRLMMSMLMMRMMKMRMMMMIVIILMVKRR
jgi:hypothetical protein